MKKAILLIVCAGTIFCSVAQQTPTETSKPVLTKDEYLQKAKGQKTGAIILIAAGGALVIAGAAVATKDLNDDLGNIFEPDTETNKHETLATVLVVAGIAAIAGSIGLFVSAHKNKKRAMSVSFKNEPTLQLQRSMAFYRSVPSFTLKISL